MSTYAQLRDLPFVPKWLGEPAYPEGFPVQPDQFTITTAPDGESLSIRQRIHEYYQKCFTEGGELLPAPPVSEDDFQVLRQWVIYMLHAPVWTLHGVDEFERLKAKALAVRTWTQLDEIGHLAMDFGLDIL